MEDMAFENIEIAPPSVVRQAAHDFAATLAETPQFEAFVRAAYCRMLGDVLSESIGLNYVTACSNSCCSGASSTQSGHYGLHADPTGCSNLIARNQQRNQPVVRN